YLNFLITFHKTNHFTMLLNMSTWWASLPLIAKIYWCIALPASVLFIIQMILTFIGGDVDGMDADGHADVSIEHDTGIEFQFITLKNLIAFFTIFGWAGIVCSGSGLGIGKTVVISTISGLIMMLIMASIVYAMGKLTDSGTLSLANAIGKIGTVYLPIPANRNGLGKVQIKVQGFQTLDAMTDHDEEIKTGTIIEVSDIIDNEILLVKPSK
ncbi:MAG: hypothetical protein JXB17_11985, partial [Bacteroidales bacterium]|nr:hypothetical protein [Bacteroidales bacterium]